MERYWKFLFGDFFISPNARQVGFFKGWVSHEYIEFHIQSDYENCWTISVKYATSNFLWIFWVGKCSWQVISAANPWTLKVEMAPWQVISYVSVEVVQFQIYHKSMTLSFLLWLFFFFFSSVGIVLMSFLFPTNFKTVHTNSQIWYFKHFFFQQFGLRTQIAKILEEFQFF